MHDKIMKLMPTNSYHKDLFEKMVKNYNHASTNTTTTNNMKRR